MNEEKLAELIAVTIRKELDDKFNPLWVDRQTHYDDHQFLGTVRRRINKIVTVGCNVLVYAILGAILTILGLGFKSWIGK